MILIDHIFNRSSRILLVLFLMCGPLSSQDLKVITYNLRLDVASDLDNRWDKRKDFLIGQLKFYEPSVFGTQEGFKHQLEAIKDGMPGYEYIGKGREDGEEKGEFSAIFYDTRVLALLSTNTFWLSENPNKPSLGWDASYNRVCTYGMFELKEGGIKFFVFNTHFDHQGELARKESARLIADKIAKLNTENLPVILMGDFNLEPDNETIAFLNNIFHDAHLLAGEEAFGPIGTYNGFDFNQAVNRRIDYLFLSKKGIRLQKYAILSDSKDMRYPSDHFPVFALISF